MVSINERLRDEAIRHQVHTLRLRAGVLRKITRLLDATDKDLAEKIAARLGDLSQADIDRLKISPIFSTQRLRALRRTIGALNASAKTILEEGLKTELRGLATDEAEYWTNTMNRVFAEDAIPLRLFTPAIETLEAAVTARPFEGAILRDHVKTWSVNRSRRVMQAIRIGAAQGESLAGISREVRRASKMSRRGAESLTRTALNHVTQHGRDAFAERNADIVRDLQWVSTLDGRTTPICIARDGKRVNRDLKGARPPAHWGCRSTTVPVTPSYRELGLDIDEVPDRTRAALNGKVAADEKYPAWFRRQDESFQRDVLGDWRFEEFKSGRFEIVDFIDYSGKWYSREDWLRTSK